MTFEEVMSSLEAMANPNTKKVLVNHGAREPLFGVKIGDMKKIVKKVKKDYHLSLQLWDTGNSDAMYLAALIADERKMTKQNLQKWVKEAYWEMLNEYAVPWIAAESNYGKELADEWLHSDEDQIQIAGWATWSSMLSIVPNDEIDIEKLRKLMKMAESKVHGHHNRISYVMNGFIIACGGFVPELTAEAIEMGWRIGKVKVNMGNTACKVSFIPDYLVKMQTMGRIGHKKSMARC